MKFKINFEHMPEYVLIQTEDEASVDGFDELLTTLVNSPKWVTGTDQIVDHRKLLMENLTLDNMKIIKEIVKIHSKKLGMVAVLLLSRVISSLVSQECTNFSVGKKFTLRLEFFAQ